MSPPWRRPSPKWRWPEQEGRAAGEELTQPALADVAVLLGDRDMVLFEASFLFDPNAVAHGRVGCRCAEDGRLVVMRQRVDPSGTAAATWAIARDEALSDDTVVYADGHTIAGRWEQCASGGTWEHDFTVTYTGLQGDLASR